MPAWENLAEFFDPKDFGDNAVITYAGGTRAVEGILDDPYLGAQIGDHTQDTLRPTFTLALSDCSGVKRFDTLTVKGVVYDIMTKPQADGTGMAIIELAKQ